MPMDLDWLRGQLPGRPLDWRPKIDSTMYAASRLAADGAPSGTVIGTDEQTAGHGRHGRPWHSEPEAGLYVSVILRLPLPPDRLPVVTLALGLAAAEAIAKSANLACDLRWPNDVLVAGKKCGGILTQLEGGAIVAGFGLNVNHAAFPAGLDNIATSLRLATGKPQSRERLLAALLPAIDTYCALLARQGTRPILDLFAQASSYVSGRRVAVDQGESTLIGATNGLTAQGFLTVRDDAGVQHTILAGGVRPCS